MEKVFSNIEPKCQCGDFGCMCGPQEVIIRMYINGVTLEPMTEAQRKWCIEQAVYAGQGIVKESDLYNLSDKDLSIQVLSMWNDFASQY
jgi:hypothetical protein